MVCLFHNLRDTMRIAFVTAALFATGIASGATPINGWYDSVFGGYAYVPNNINNTYASVKHSNALYQNGYDAGGSLGYKSTPMRYEGELTYLNASLKRFNSNNIRQVRVSGYSNAILAMANVFYDFPGLVAPIQPFLGAGIGYGWVNAKLKAAGPAPITRLTGSTQFTGANSVFAYQAAGGLTYNFSENYALNVGYRYVITTRAAELGKVFQANLANLGATYRFDGSSYK